MSIDERLDRLTERHEALAQSLELMIAEGREQGERIRALERLAQQDGENIRVLAGLVQQDGEHIRALEGLAQQDGENIRALARIAEIHERRLTDLEGQE